VLASDPGNALAKQKLKEIEEKRNPSKASQEKAEEEAKLKAAAEAKHKADEEAKLKAAADAKRKADEEANQKAAEEAKRKAAEEAKHKAEEEAKLKAAEEAKLKAAEEAKRKAEEEERYKAALEAKRQADEEATRQRAAETKRKADEDAQKANTEAKRKAQEDADKKNKLSSDDILSVMQSDTDELIGDTQAKTAPVAAKAAAEVDPQAKESIAAFLKNNAMEASLLIGADGKLLDSAMPNGTDAPALGAMASSIFSNTEKAAQRMRFGNLAQVIVSSEDGRQILFVSLKTGVLVAVTGKGTNLGQLRIAINELKKKA
jgi:predicted regulator of Ras-like GTPase activity (Roadblock/LC7/MglB family)